MQPSTPETPTTDTRQRSRLIKSSVAALLVGLFLGSFITTVIFLHRRSIIVRFEEQFVQLTDTTDMGLPDGVYNGTIIRGTKIRHGDGRFQTFSGNIYEGDWRNDKLSFGKRTSRNSVYTGRFNEDLQNHGFGIITYNDAFVQAKIKAGEPPSQVIVSYIGNWQDDVKQGQGRSVMKDGSMEFGQYVEGVLQKVKGANYKVGEQVYGIDVSHFQPDIDWSELAIYCNAKGEAYRDNKHKDNDMLQPVLFAYIKATEGATIKDEYYSVRMIEAERHGIVKGAYHMLHLSTSTIDDQLRNFFETVSWSQGDMPPALDIECDGEIKQCGIMAFRDSTMKWLTAVERKFGARPIIYTNEGIRKNFMQDSCFSTYDIWISKYKDTTVQSDWLIWQFADHLRVKGSRGKTDVNIFKGNYKQFADRFLSAPQTQN